jgi:Arc/MetJ-type ribon-helix-helix transcriptional regulator
MSPAGLARSDGYGIFESKGIIYIMTILLEKDLEQIVHDAMLSGLYAREDDVIRDALTRLKQSMPDNATAMPTQKAKRARPGQAKKKPLTPDELNQRLLASGLVTQLPDPTQDIDDDDLPIVIQGEPLSETIIRERR